MYSAATRSFYRKAIGRRSAIGFQGPNERESLEDMEMVTSYSWVDSIASSKGLMATADGKQGSKLPIVGYLPEPLIAITR